MIGDFQIDDSVESRLRRLRGQLVQGDELIVGRRFGG